MLAVTRIRCVKLIAGKGTGAQYNAVRNELAGLKAKRELVATLNNLAGRSANGGMVVTLLPKRA